MNFWIDLIFVCWQLQNNQYIWVDSKPMNQSVMICFWVLLTKILHYPFYFTVMPVFQLSNDDLWHTSEGGSKPVSYTCTWILGIPISESHSNSAACCHQLQGSTWQWILEWLNRNTSCSWTFSHTGWCSCNITIGKLITSIPEASLDSKEDTTLLKIVSNFSLALHNHQVNTVF